MPLFLPFVNYSPLRDSSIYHEFVLALFKILQKLEATPRDEDACDFNVNRIVSPFFGMADTIALGAVLAVCGCGGPFIPFKSFRRQGLNETEMITLVACGHPLSGVRQTDFPLIVTNTSTDVDTFDTTPAFDNTIVSQYLQNTTEDVLVVGPHVTTRSDFRIFSSDGNVTMQSLLSSDTFNSTCGGLIQRLINTVPNGVNLTDPITEPFDYLISDPYLAYQNGSFFMTTTLRVLNPSANPTMTMLWADRQGNPSFCPSTGCSVQSSGIVERVFMGIIGQTQGLTAERYSFNATINATSSISQFWFEIDNNDGSEPIIVDNGGSGFVIAQDTVFVDVGRSKLLIDLSAGTQMLKIVVAVRGDTESVSLTGFDPLSTSPAPICSYDYI
ncbi:hypothetical protein BT96DRAFT_1020381 [Gymnopus androsaceus JB14]|uniref:Uncharacterized protein n=1 Tax=Gymnopus androsaceus JB14 TaxID=1447944 RepID=A0A6A4HLU7_9AGAR|nr:hypothetical protein BT96DRAFT_1020381 [Gymnopus androsaceus JB14]